MGSLGKVVEQAIFFYLFIFLYSEPLSFLGLSGTWALQNECTHRREMTTGSLALCTKYVRPILSLYVNNSCHLPWLWKSHSHTSCGTTEPQCAPIHGRGISTGPGGLATPHITERWNYLQTPDSGRTVFAFSGAVHGLRERTAKTFLKNLEFSKPWPARNSLLYRLERCLSRQSTCFCRGHGLGAQHLDGGFETACNSSSKVSRVLFWHLWTPGTHAMSIHTCRWKTYTHKNKRDISKRGGKERQKRKKGKFPSFWVISPSALATVLYSTRDAGL